MELFDSFKVLELGKLELRRFYIMAEREKCLILKKIN